MIPFFKVKNLCALYLYVFPKRHVKNAVFSMTSV